MSSLRKPAVDWTNFRLVAGASPASAQVYLSINQLASHSTGKRCVDEQIRPIELHGIDTSKKLSGTDE